MTWLLLFIVVVVTPVVFVGWVILAGTRSLWRLVAGEVRTMPSTAATTAGPRCNNSGCGTINPTQARFCRRCGSAMGVSASVPMYPRAEPSRSVA